MREENLRKIVDLIEENKFAVFRNRLFIRIVVFSFSFLVSLVSVDILIRPIVAKRIYVRPTLMFRNPWPINSDLLRYDRDVNFLGEIFGDLAAFFEDSVYQFKRVVHFRTDEIGFRNQPQKRLEENRVIIVGDSFGAGSGGSQENMFSSVLEQRFGVNNYNLSVGGVGPWQELMTLKYEIQNISVGNDGIVLWLLFSGNDLDDYYGDYFEIRENGVLDQLVIRADTFRKRSPIMTMIAERKDRRNLVEIINVGEQELLFYSPYFERMNRSVEDIISHGNFPKFQKVFDEITELCSANQLDLYVVLVPSKAETYSWAFRGTDRQPSDDLGLGFSIVVRQMCESSGIRFLDLTPSLAKISREQWQRKEQLLYWPDDTHWNDFGQLVAAGIVFEDFFTSESSAGNAKSAFEPAWDDEIGMQPDGFPTKN